MIMDDEMLDGEEELDENGLPLDVDEDDLDDEEDSEEEEEDPTMI